MNLNVPAGAHRDRIIDGTQSWNALQAYPRYEYAGTTSESKYPLPCAELGYQENSVEWGEFGGPQAEEPYAALVGCWSLSQRRMINFQIKISDDQPWYTGVTGGGVTGTTLVDLRSIATHEFGHAAGRITDDGHFLESDAVCPASYGTRHTMCPSFQPGVSGWRNFETHDISTHAAAY